MSKEIRTLWQYERALLTHYQWFLKILERTWEKRNSSQKDQPPTPLAITSIITLCELLKAHPNFNFRSNILSIVARQTNNRKCEQIVTACCDAITYLFTNDRQGEVTLEATKLLTKMVHSRKFQVRPELIRTFLSLPLRVHQDEAEAAKIAQKAQAKKRKRHGESTATLDAEIENEMREQSGGIDKIALARNQSDTLQSVILTYFRILKADPKENRHVIILLPESLRGLAKFSHLIHFETVLDLLKVLRKLLESVEALPLDAALNAVLTAFQTLQGPGRELQIDQKEYITPLYTQITRLISNNARTTVPATLNCLTLAFLKRREYSTVRTAGFFKQILTTCLHTETHLSIPLIAFARQLMQRYASINQLLENESDIITSGAYTPDVMDPEHSNPFATSAWELGLLKFHVDPMMGKHHASACSENKILQYPTEAPDRIFEERMRFHVEKGYIGCQIRCKKHPFRHSAPNQNENEHQGRTKRRQREQYRFIKPRKTTSLHLKPFSEL